MDSQPLFTPEQELLLCCARTRFSVLYSDRVRQLAQDGLQWDTILDLSETHKLTQLVYHNLKTNCPEIVPPQVMQQLQGLYSTHVQYILFLTGELVSLVKEFSARGIKVLPYKGPVLASQIYGNLALRPFIDLDILVRTADLTSAKSLLLEKGYQLTWPELPLSSALEKVHIRTKYNYQFVHPARQITLELHWAISPNYLAFPSRPEWLWQDLDTLTLAGTELLAFPVEKLLIILCVHGGNHLWDRVGWICDIAELIAHYPALNWGSVFRDASTFGVQRFLLTGLSLAHDLLHAALPVEILKKIEADTEVQWLAQSMIRRFASFRWSHSGFLDIPLYHLRARERFRDKVNYCLQMAIPSLKDRAFLPLPEKLNFLYYLIRPVRLAVEYGISPLLKR
jgi:hypothetical protein